MDTVRSDTTPFGRRPVVSLDVPAGWEPFLVPAAEVAVTESEPRSPYRPNVVVTVARAAGAVGPEAALSQAVEDNTAALEAADGWTEIGSEYRTVVGVDGFRIEGAFVIPGVGTVFQGVWLAAVASGSLVDVIAVTATCGADDGERLVPVLRQIAGSARLA